MRRRSRLARVARTGLLFGCLGFAGPIVLGQDAYPVNVVGELVNFETPLIDPIIATTDGQYVVVAHEADERLIVLNASTLAVEAEVVVGLGATALLERPGAQEIWVSSAFSSAVMVVDTTDWRVTHLLKPPPEAFLGHRATPGGIAFSEDGTKAWVVATTTDSLNVYDAESKEFVRTVPLVISHNGSQARVQEPRSIVRHGDKLYVGVFRSGNNSAAGPFVPLGHFSQVADLQKIEGYSLPDADVLVLSTLDEELVEYRSGVGTLLYDLAVDGVNERLVVANMDSLNREFIGEGSFPAGRMTKNQLTFVDLTDPPRTSIVVSLDDLPDSEVPVRVAMPTSLIVTAERIFVAGYASATVASFDLSGRFLGSFATDSGPRGLAVSPDELTLYSYNRMDSSVTAFDLTSPPTAAFARVELFDPTYDDVVDGRRLFHDASLSGGGFTGCFSCHPDARQDGLSWDLSAYHDQGDGFTPQRPPQFWSDRKFVMTTQDCRSLEDTAPYHWRGEKQDLVGFNGAFEALLKGEPLALAEFAKIEAYLFQTVYPANPFLPVDRQHSPLAESGRRGYVGELTCFRCHGLPTASSGTIGDRFRVGRQRVAEDSLFATNPPQLRGLWTKVSDVVDLSDAQQLLFAPIGGFGLDRVGSHRDTEQFVRLSFPDFTDFDHQRLMAFVEEMDTGIAPAANTSHFLSSETVDVFPGSLLIEQANALSCDLAAHGRVDVGNGWQEVGLVFDRQTQSFVTDSSLAPLGLDEVLELAEQGLAELLVLGVPYGSGERVGVDRDRDGLFDRTELELGTDPANADSDGDGFWDSYDDDPLKPSDTVQQQDAPRVEDLRVLYTTSGGAKLVYRTDTFSPTHVVFGISEDYDQMVGDALELPDGSNHWKRVHSVMLKGLEDDAPYHFKVLTRGQNGVEGGSEDRLVRSRWDTFHLIWVESVLLEIQRVDDVTTATASVKVVDNDGLAVSGAEIHGVVTVFRDGEPMTQFEASGGLTQADGVGLVTFELEAESGDEVEFFVPMYQGDEDERALAGIEPPDGPESFFAWSESLETSARSLVP